MIAIAAAALGGWIVDRLVGRVVIPRTGGPVARKRLLAAVLVWFFVLTPAASFALYEIAVRLARFRAAPVSPEDTALLAAGPLLAVVSAFLAFFLTGLPLTLAVERGEWKSMSPAMRLLALLAFAFFISIPASLAAAMIDWYVILSPGGIRYNQFLSLTERSYSWAQTQAIRAAPAWEDDTGNPIPGREYFLCFPGGGSWGTMWHPGTLPQAGKERIILRIVEQAGIPVTELKVLRLEDQNCPPGQ